VARQKRAAVRGETLDTAEVLLGLRVVIQVIITAAKIAQAAKQFYPERRGKAYRKKAVEIGLSRLRAFNDGERAQASPDVGRAILAGSGS
jgi:hypothetical protein